uniref:Uncharacterized protein n=1 Tax=Knipowitschia caucasica TaxID=637954 RepID=A0AAV2IT84_KNICA
MRESVEDCVHLHGLTVPGLELVLEFIKTSKVKIANETLEDLVETASFLQVTSILTQLSLEIQLENCVKLYGLSEVYGAHDLHSACLTYMRNHYHHMLRRSDFSSLPVDVRAQVKELRMKEDPWSMLMYEELEQRWKPLANNLPTDMLNVRGYGSAVLDNYLFIVGGYRMTSQEISAVHCYNPFRNEWSQLASLNQKRSNFKLIAVQGKLYAVGGQCLGTVECYSPEQDGWTCVSSMPDPLTEFSACECQGVIYIMGGYTSRDRNTDVLRYCPSADAWTVFRSCSTHIRKQQMLSVEDTIYLVGGYTHEMEPRLRRPGETEDVLTVQSYHVTTGEWLQLKENSSKSAVL